jgi:hypothetical protein
LGGGGGWELPVLIASGFVVIAVGFVVAAVGIAGPKHLVNTMVEIVGMSVEAVTEIVTEKTETAVAEVVAIVVGVVVVAAAVVVVVVVAVAAAVVAVAAAAVVVVGWRLVVGVVAEAIGMGVGEAAFADGVAKESVGKEVEVEVVGTVGVVTGLVVEVAVVVASVRRATMTVKMGMMEAASNVDDGAAVGETVGMVGICDCVRKKWGVN